MTSAVKTKKKELLKYVSKKDLKESANIPNSYIKKIKTILYKEGLVTFFKTFYYDQTVYIEDHKIEGVSCNCYNYMFHDSCIHVAAILDNN